MMQKRISVEAPSTGRPVLPSSQARACLEYSTADHERYAAMIAALNAELELHLDTSQQREYMAALLQYAAPPADADLRRLVIGFHHDHRLVEALQNRAHPQHEAVWGQWCTDALRILQHQHLGTPGDALGDTQDLAQVALEDLMRALPTFRYASRFSTWAYIVISHSAQRYLRDLRAAKRNRPTEPLDRPAALHVAALETEQPETHAEERALAALINAVLGKQPDQRWATIFHLWMYKDQRLADIGKHVGVSGSRVSVLLEQIILALRENPELLEWLDHDLTAAQERASGEDVAQTKDHPI